MDEVQDVRGLAARDAGRHIDQRQPPHQVRPLLAQHDSRQPTKAHAHDDGGRGREGVDGVCYVGRRGDRVHHGHCRGCRVVRVAVARQVDGDEWQDERQGHRVPRVRVLRAAVQQDYLGRRVAPDQRGDLPVVGAGQSDRLATHLWRLVVRDPVLLSILVEHGELVVGHAQPAQGSGTAAPRQHERGSGRGATAGHEPAVHAPATKRREPQDFSKLATKGEITVPWQVCTTVCMAQPRTRRAYMIGWPGCGGGGQPGIRVASRMACISSETSSGLFWV